MKKQTRQKIYQELAEYYFTEMLGENKAGFCMDIPCMKTAKRNKIKVDEDCILNSFPELQLFNPGTTSYLNPWWSPIHGLGTIDEIRGTIALFALEISKS